MTKSMLRGKAIPLELGSKQKTDGIFTPEKFENSIMSLSQAGKKENTGPGGCTSVRAGPCTTLRPARGPDRGELLEPGERKRQPDRAETLEIAWGRGRRHTYPPTLRIYSSACLESEGEEAH